MIVHDFTESVHLPGEIKRISVFISPTELQRQFFGKTGATPFIEACNLIFQPYESHHIEELFPRLAFDHEYFKGIFDRSRMMLQHFAGKDSCFSPQGKALLSVLGLPERIRLNLYFSEGKLALACCPLANWIYRKTGNAMRIIHQEKDLAVFSLPNQERLTAEGVRKTGTVYFLFERVGKEIFEVEVAHPHEPFPLIFLIIYSGGSGEFLYSRAMTKINYDQRACRRSEILSYSLPRIRSIHDHVGASRQLSISEVARAFAKGQGQTVFSFFDPEVLSLLSLEANYHIAVALTLARKLLEFIIILDPYGNQ
ncbi:MAG: hypothetical protein WC624_06180 [Candidatus Margulisiibacteriota bacterium]